jgi:Cu2+-exporting ATPase
MCAPSAHIPGEGVPDSGDAYPHPDRAPARDDSTLSKAALAVGDSALPSDPGTSVIAFTHKGRFALLSIRQQLRPDARRVITALQARGHRIVILSGDRPGVVAPIARALGVADWSAGLTPIEKIAFIDQFKAQGRRVLMVGDGLNDAPSLAAAHVSLSPISATELTQAQADGVFLGERLTPVLQAVTIAVRARRLMHQNLWLAGIYNAVAVPVAIAGLATPLIASLAMSGSSLLVTLNALRARGRLIGAAHQASVREAMSAA